jgi:hypothetical protein
MENFGRKFYSCVNYKVNNFFPQFFFPLRAGPAQPVGDLGSRLRPPREEGPMIKFILVLKKKVVKK